MGPRSELSHLSDQEVVALALERRKGAWAELVFCHIKQVRWIIGRHVATEEHVEQLIQDTFFKAVMFLGSYHPDKSFAAWISAIAYHTAIDYARRRPPDCQSSRLRRSVNLVDIGVPHTAEFPTDPGTPRLRAAVEDALDQLRPTHRACVEMHVIQQRTYDEIAQELDLPVGTVKSHLHRALKKLRGLLGHVLDSSDPHIRRPKNDGAVGELTP
jgi:RNA polymerase sigma-70 factor (ECF subfamily)